MTINHRILLARRPEGAPRQEDFELSRETPRRPILGEVAVSVRYVSLDPAMRGWMDDRPSYLPPVGLGETMRATAIGEVIESAADGFQPGDIVLGHLGVQTHAVVPAAGLRKMNAELAPLDVQIGLCSTSGLTAYFGLLDIGKPLPGETVLVSGAAGAVGSVVGQIARLQGCHVVGTAGGREKQEYIFDELGFNAAIDYKQDDWRTALKGVCDEGIDVYFDNVGNPMLDAALRLINQNARIVLCGAISQYNATGKVDGPSNYISLIVKRARMEGFIVFDYADRYDEATRALANWWKQGDLTYRVDTSTGIDNFHAAFMRMFNGQNVGKAILDVG